MKRKISGKLFSSYAICSVVGVLIVMTCTVWYVLQNMNSSFITMEEQIQININQNIDYYFKGINEYSRNLAMSDEFKDLVKKRLPEKYEKGEILSGEYQNLGRVLTGAVENGYSISVISKSKQTQYYVWMDKNFGIERINLKYKQELNKEYEKYKMDGTPFISIGTELYDGEETNRMILSRTMTTNNGIHYGNDILRVSVEQDKFINSMDRLISRNMENEMKVSIYSENGLLIFSNMPENNKISFENAKDPSYTTDNYRFQRYTVDTPKLLVVYATPTEAYMVNGKKFLLIASVFVLITLVGILIITKILSSKISKPINELCAQMQTMSLDKGINYNKVNTDIYELDYLADTFRQLGNNLDKSLNDILRLKDQEIQARMTALQAQMQPHFLYNTMTTIGSIAQDAGNDEISTICTKLMQMFRYVADEQSGGVKLYEEIKHIDNYVDIMKERFPEAVVDMDIPIEIMGAKIPKLVIQPLVENAFKYCNRSKPYIQIIGTFMQSGEWKIQVKDNGKGFDHEKRNEVMAKCREYLREGKPGECGIDGMGLVNVYVRMHLYYGDKASYEISENEAAISIGGTMEAMER